MAHESVRYGLEDAVAVVRIDDGKANGLSHAVIDALQELLDQAEKEARAVLLVGRETRFSGGFDLGTMRAGPEAARGLVKAGAELFLRMQTCPLPIAVCCTGHAIAAGALVLLASDARIGARGDFKIGLSEVAISMTLPLFAVELARLRLSKRHFLRATSQAQMYTPDEAVDAGYLDRVVAPDEAFSASLAEASRLGQLPQPAYGHTKGRVNAATVASIRETLEHDLAALLGGSSG